MLLQFRKIVLDCLASVLALDEVVEHAALNGAGTVKRIQRGQVFHAARLVAAQNVAHARRFELKYAAGERLAEDLVGFWIVQRQIFQHQLHAVPLLDQFQRIVDQRERGETEKVHLEKPQFVEAVHVVLGDDFLAVCAIQRDECFQRLGRNHHAGRMHGSNCALSLRGVPRHPALPSRADLCGQLPRSPAPSRWRLQVDVQNAGHQFGDPLSHQRS